MGRLHRVGWTLILLALLVQPVASLGSLDAPLGATPEPLAPLAATPGTAAPTHGPLGEGPLPADIDSLAGTRRSFEVHRSHGLMPHEHTGTSGFRVEPGTPWKNALDNHDRLVFRCPQPDPADPLGDTNVLVQSARCPFRVIDGGDLLGSPQLAVDHEDVNNMAFFSLHGGASDQGPTPRSRGTNPVGGDQRHTTFTSVSEGRSWEDQPYASVAFGEQTSGIMDRNGNLYISALFATETSKDAAGNPVYDSFFRLYKENRPSDTLQYYGEEVFVEAAGNRIEEVNLVLVTPRTQIETQAEYDEARNRTGNGTAPSRDGDVGNATIAPEDEADTSNDLVVAVYHERAYDYNNTATGKSSWITAMWSTTTSDNTWQALPSHQAIGPCRDASNPTTFNGRVYVACSVDAGYDDRRGARIGDIDIWAIDPSDGSTELISMAPVREGRPRLAMNLNGDTAITTTKLLGEEPYPDVRVDLAFGYYGKGWLGASDVGAELHRTWGIPMVDARITSMVLLNDRPTLYLSYMERSNNTLGQPGYDPNQGLPTGNEFIEYHKLIATFETCSPIIAKYDLQLGTVRHPFEEGVVNGVTGAFDDLQDGMQVVYHPTYGKELVYFAYGDHGAIQYGAVDGDSGSSTCALPLVPPLFIPAPPVPAALTLGSGVPTAFLATAGIASAAGLGMLLNAKRRAAFAVTTKAK